MNAFVVDKRTKGNKTRHAIGIVENSVKCTSICCLVVPVEGCDVLETFGCSQVLVPRT